MLERVRSLPFSLSIGGVLCAALLSGCSDGPVEAHPGEAMGECEAIETSYENSSADHVAQCSELAYPMNPPVFGAHYPVWAAYGTYDFPVPLGFLVHNLEHGAVLFLYNCPDGCADEVAEAQALIDELPEDPRCSSNVGRQIVLAPEPTLDSRWAAAAWGYSLVASCLDVPLFRDFYDRHTGQGEEDTCANGVLYTESPCE